MLFFSFLYFCNLWRRHKAERLVVDTNMLHVHIYEYDLWRLAFHFANSSGELKTRTMEKTLPSPPIFVVLDNSISRRIFINLILSLFFKRQWKDSVPIRCKNAVQKVVGIKSYVLIINYNIRIWFSRNLVSQWYFHFFFFFLVFLHFYSVVGYKNFVRLIYICAQ